MEWEEVEEYSKKVKDVKTKKKIEEETLDIINKLLPSEKEMSRQKFSSLLRALNTKKKVV